MALLSPWASAAVAPADVARGSRRPPPQAFYFPWVLCAIRVLMGGSAVPDLIGIFAGHVYYFLEDVQGYRLKAPLFLADALDTPATGVQRAAQQHRNAFGGHNWGAGGQRLGGN